MLNRIIKSKKNIPLYLMITLVPAIMISHFIALQTVHEHKRTYLNKAESYAILHANDIDRFIGETISRLDMLATLIAINPTDLDNVEEILTRINEKDFRFSGFYWANPVGDLVVGTNELSTPINVADREYFQEALQTGIYTISPAHIGRVTGRFIITIAVPVVQSGEISGVLLGSLRIDKIEEAVHNKRTDELIFVRDDLEQTIIQASASPLVDHAYSHQLDIERVPWTITAQITSDKSHVYERAFLINVGLFLILTHILYLLFQYYLLKQQMKLEQQQNKRQKLELVENLAASTAHEIRNPLTGIKGLVQLLSEKYKEPKDQLYFKIIQDEVSRINSIVSELLLLGKPTANSLITCDANEVIKEIAPIIESEANYNSIDLSIHYSTQELLISCVKDHLKQVILNLIKNALEAVNTDGKVIVSLERQDQTCLIKVTDNGYGMSEDVLNQVFDSFFTMKENGTGLGLVVCRRIIHSYGGSITIKSQLNKGTEIDVCIPLVKE